jgi:hypothetical protein
VITLRLCAWILALVMGEALLFPAAALQSNESTVRDISIDSISFSNIDPDGAELEVRIVATPVGTATVRSLNFDRVTLNGIRVTVAPASITLRLRKDEPFQDMPPLRTRLAFRDLDSLEPVRRIMREGTARVQAVLRGQLQLNFFQRAALRGGGAWVVTHLDRDVPVEIPGGSMGRLAALAALTAAEPLWAANAALRRTWEMSREEAARALPVISESLAAVETRYDLKSRGGEVVTVRHWSSGFAAADDRVLVPAESVEPWMFDTAIAEAIASREVSVVASSVDIVVTTATTGSRPPRVFSSRHGEVRVSKKQEATRTAISPSTRRRFRVRFRADDANVALLEVRGWTAPVLPTAPERTGWWQPATLVIPRRQNGGVEAELLEVFIGLENGRYRLRHPVDASAFGSPVWMDTGVVGLLQDENSAAPMISVMRRLN